MKIAAETDLLSDLLLGSEILYHVDLSFIFAIHLAAALLFRILPHTMAGSHGGNFA